MEKHCTDLTLLCIDKKHLLLQCHAAGKMDLPSQLPLQICIEYHSIVNLYPLFYLRAYLWHSEPFMKTSDACWVSSLFLVIIDIACQNVQK